MSAKVKKHLLICTLILLLCFLVSVAAYDSHTATVVDDINYKEDTLRLTVRAGKILDIELHRPFDDCVYHLEIRTIDAGTTVSKITRYRENDVEVLELPLPQTQELVLIRNNQRICIYSFEQTLIRLLKKAPDEIPRQFSSRFRVALRTTRTWGLLIVLAYLTLNELGIFNETERLEDRQS